MAKWASTALVVCYACLVVGYVGTCELRAPTPWLSCDARWNFALGVLVPSPLTAAYRSLQQRQSGRRRTPSRKKSPPAP